MGRAGWPGRATLRLRGEGLQEGLDRVEDMGNENNSGLK